MGSIFVLFVGGYVLSLINIRNEQFDLSAGLCAAMVEKAA